MQVFRKKTQFLRYTLLAALGLQGKDKDGERTNTTNIKFILLLSLTVFTKNNLAKLNLSSIICIRNLCILTLQNSSQESQVT